MCGSPNEFHWVINKLNGHNALGLSIRLHSYIIILGTCTASLTLSCSFLGRKVSITHARKPRAQHPWYVPGAYVNSEAASPAISGPAALVASSGSRSIPHVWLSRCRAGPVLTAATDSSRARASETRTRTLAP